VYRVKDVIERAVKMEKIKIVLFAFATVTILIATALGISQYVLYYPNTATFSEVIEIGVYDDPQCLSKLTNGTTIDWGVVAVGTNTKIFWIKNHGNSMVTLSLVSSGLPSGWSISWDYDGTEVAPNEVRKVTIILTVPSEAIAGTYYWDTWITADKK